MRACRINSRLLAARILVVELARRTHSRCGAGDHTSSRGDAKRVTAFGDVQLDTNKGHDARHILGPEAVAAKRRHISSTDDITWTHYYDCDHHEYTTTVDHRKRQRFKTDRDPSTLGTPAYKKALQGHPALCALWEKIIVGALQGPELGFKKSITHERQNLYQGEIDGEFVLVVHHADDFAIASRSTAATEKLISVIDLHATTSCEGIGIKTAQDYIKLSPGATLIQCSLQQTHGRETPGSLYIDDLAPDDAADGTGLPADSPLFASDF